MLLIPIGALRSALRAHTRSFATSTCARFDAQSAITIRITAIASLALGVTPPATSDDRAELRSRLIEIVEQAMQCDIPVVAEIRNELWAQTEPGAPLPSEPLRHERSIVQYDGGRWREITDTVVRVSDGTHGWTLFPTMRLATGSGRIGHPYDAMLEVLLHREGFDGWSAVPTLALELRECEVLHIESLGDGIRCEYIIPRSSTVLPRPWRYEIHVEASPPRIVMYGSRSWSPTEERFHEIMRYDVREWMSVGDRMTPRVVDRWRPGTETISRFVVVSARVPDPEERETWRMGLPREPGWTVRDTALRLEWVTGERELVVAGTRYRLKSPLFEHPGENLARLLEEAEAIDGAVDRPNER